MQLALNVPVSLLNDNRTLFRLIGMDMNSTADQVFTPLFAFNRYRITEIVVTNASATLAGLTRTLAVRTATGGGGTAIVTAQNLTALVLPDNMIVCTLASSDFRANQPLYALLTGAAGVAATADIYINGYAVS